MPELSAANGRDPVARTLEFADLERVAVCFVPPRHTHIALTTTPDERGWHIGGLITYHQRGCGWTTLNTGMGKVTHHLLASWEKFASYPWPGFSEPQRYRLTEVIVAQVGGRYLLAGEGEEVQR